MKVDCWKLRENLLEKETHLLIAWCNGRNTGFGAKPTWI